MGSFCDDDFSKLVSKPEKPLWNISKRNSCMIEKCFQAKNSWVSGRVAALSAFFFPAAFGLQTSRKPNAIEKAELHKMWVVLFWNSPWKDLTTAWLFWTEQFAGNYFTHKNSAAFCLLYSLNEMRRNFRTLHCIDDYFVEFWIRSFQYQNTYLPIVKA